MAQRYQLREAAGCFFLLDMEQEPDSYRKPLCLNQTGADIFGLLQENGSLEETAGIIAKRYGISEEAAREDIGSFTDMLWAQGIKIKVE